MSGPEGKPLGDRRAEEAFAALAAGKARQADGSGGGGAGPWKVATFLFLALALALPIAAGVRESRRDIADAERVDGAREDLFAVRNLSGDRRLPAAVRALGDATASLSDLPGLTETVAGLVRALEEERELRDREIAQARATLAADGRRAATYKVALDAVLAGSGTPPASLLGDDAVSVALRTLFDRLVSFDGALAADDPGERLAKLAVLAEAWPFPAVARARKALVEDLASEAAVRQALTAARNHVRAGDGAAARRAIDEAGESARRQEMETIVRGLLRLSRLEQAAALEATDPATAVALYRSAALESEDPSDALTGKIAALDDGLRRAALVAGLRHLAAGARSAGELALAAAFYEALAGLDGDEAARGAALEARVLLAIMRAEDHLRQGRLEAARVFAEEAGRLGAKPADALLRSIETAAAARAAGDRAEQAREALAAGAPDLALRLLRGSEAPAALREKAEEMRRERAVTGARAALFAADAEGALAALGETGDEGALRAYAEFLRGRVDEGISAYTGPAEEGRMILYRAAAALLTTDPAAAGRLAARAKDLGGGTEELVSALAAALDAADAGVETMPFWTALREEALKRAPLPPPAAGPRQEPGGSGD
ncbi:MAG: hypothetical protein MUE73_01660 [Planctomycetes bacterium]|jgi:hypothetical protein|nr:hypothetical protein [Planctomycetota bacterium]